MAPLTARESESSSTAHSKLAMSTAASSRARRGERDLAIPETEAVRVKREERCRTRRCSVLAQSAKTFMDLPIGRLRRQPLSKFLRAATGLYRIRHKAEVRNPENGAVCSSFGVARPLQDRDAAVRTQVAEHLPFDRGRAFGAEPYGARDDIYRREIGIGLVTLLVRGFVVRLGFTPFLGRRRFRCFDCRCTSLRSTHPTRVLLASLQSYNLPSICVTEFTTF